MKGFNCMCCKGQPQAKNIKGIYMKNWKKLEDFIYLLIYFTRDNAELVADTFCIHTSVYTIFTVFQPSSVRPNVHRLVLMWQVWWLLCSHQKLSMAPRAWSLITRSPGCVHTWHEGRVAMEGGLSPVSSTLAPGAPMDLNEEVSHIHSYQVTNQIMLIARDSTQDKRIHLVSLASIVSLPGYNWGPG